MALRVSILASGVFLLSAQVVSVTAGSMMGASEGAGTAYSLLFVDRAEAHSASGHDHHPRHYGVEAKSHIVHHQTAAISMGHSVTPRGQEIVFASSRVRWPQVVYGTGSREGKKPALVSDSGVLAAMGRISVASLLPAPHVATRELGSVVECVSQAVAGEARGEVDTRTGRSRQCHRQQDEDLGRIVLCSRL